MIDKLKRHLKVFGIAVLYGMGAYAVIQVMMALSRWAGYDF